MMGILRRVATVRRPGRIEGRTGAVGCVRRFAGHRTGASAVEFALPGGAIPGPSGRRGGIRRHRHRAADPGHRGRPERPAAAHGHLQDGSDGSDPSQRLRKIVCTGPSALFPCADLRLDVSRTPSFSASQPAEPFDKATKTWTPGFGQRSECPQGGDTVTVRVAVPVMRLFQMLDFTGRIMSDKTQLLVTTEIFRAEDYEPKPC
ncbi:TadE/TadG family type IV pilus assembly protein [Methylobacterium oryzae CBMB20]